MSFPLSYCPHGEQVLNRLRALYEKRSPEIVLAKMNVPGPALQDFHRTHPPGFCEYPDLRERVAFWDASTREHIAVDDDSIPSAYLTELDQGLYGGLFGGEVRFLCDPSTGWISSMVVPLLNDWSEFDALSFRTDHEWYRRYVNELNVFVTAARGKYGISHFILINHLNFIFELVGATRTYMALEDDPERVRRAIDLAHAVNLNLHQTFFDKASLLEGGTCGYTIEWLPGRIISESVDPFHMTSVDHFERWAREPVERIFSQFDGGVTHIHGNGRHLLPAVSSLKGLKAIMLGDDKGWPRAFDILADVRRQVGDMPLVCEVEFPQFNRALREHTLVGGVLYQVHDVPDVAAANRCMDVVRRYGV